MIENNNNKKKRVIVEWAMHYRPIIIMLLSCLMAFGMVALSKMKKNEFPDFTIRQGIVIAVYPGATSAEIEQQVTKPLEDYIFSYKEVKKAKTMSISRDGMAIIQVQLNDDLEDKDEFWSKFKHGIDGFKSSSAARCTGVDGQGRFRRHICPTHHHGESGQDISRAARLHGRTERQACAASRMWDG
jgi:hypothetical protein